MFILYLNDMRSSNIEILTRIAKADDPTTLHNLMTDCEGPWADGKWNKYYRKDSPLEWCNPPYDPGTDGVIEVLSIEEYVEDQRKRYQKLLDSIPTRYPEERV